MVITGPISGTPGVAVNVSQPVQAAWRAGQVLDATVVQVGASNSVKLRIGATVVEARTDLKLAAGTQLQLRVTQPGRLPVLQVAATTTPPDPQSQALRSLLPRQHPLPPLLSNLSHLAGQTNARSVPLNPETLTLGRQVFEALPSSKSVSTPQGLRRALVDSGLFLEAKLARQLNTGQRSDLGSDFKAGLLRLFNRLTASGAPSVTGSPAPDLRAATPPPLRGQPPHPQANVPATLAQAAGARPVAAELLQQVDAGIARIQTSQLASLPNEATHSAVWTAEVPVRHQNQTNVFDFRIARDGRGDTSTGMETWSVSLAFDLEQLGPVRALVSISGTQASVNLWAEQADTAQLFNNHLESLRSGMAGAGLGVGQVCCRHGVPPTAPPDEAAYRLLDTTV